MNPAILIELAKRWEADAELQFPTTDHSESIEDKIHAAKAQAERETKRECADTLRTLVSLLGKNT